MTRVSNLYAIEAVRDEPFDRLATSFRTGVREHRESTAGMNEGDRISHGQPVLGNVPWSASTQVAVERVARVTCPTAIDEHPGEMRAADRGVTGARQHVLERDPNTQRIELRDDLDGARVAAIAKLPKRLLDGTRSLNMQAEQVDLALIVGRAQLDTRHDPNAIGVRGGDRLGDTIHRVVIGEGDGRETRGFRRCYHRGWRLGAIGRRRMGMQVDMRPFGPASAGRCSTHFV